MVFKNKIIILLLVFSSVSCVENKAVTSDKDTNGDESITIITSDKFQCDDVTSNALAQLNQLRVKAGLSELSNNDKLQAAAEKHSKFLTTNIETINGNKRGLSGHIQDYSKYKINFSGATPEVRAAKEGLKTIISENVSTHSSATYLDSIDGLMSAIYHRYGFFDVTINNIGVGQCKGTTEGLKHIAFTYNMVNIETNDLCSTENFVKKTDSDSSGNSVNYINTCLDLNGKQRDDGGASFTKYEEKLAAVANNNPNIIKWPGVGSTNITPVFFEESPDPLLDYSVSGYPVSVEFNKYKFTSSIPTVSTFTLTNTSTSEIVPLVSFNNRGIIVSRLNSKTDPNNKDGTNKNDSNGIYESDGTTFKKADVSEYQHAIFPESRLDWGTKYKVNLTYSDGTASQSQEWNFTTKTFASPILTIPKDTIDFLVDTNDSNDATTSYALTGVTAGSKFILYSVPKDKRDANSGLGISHRSTVNIDTNKIIDGNTLELEFSGEGLVKIDFHGRKITFAL